MPEIDNPRFPHFCRILRYAETESMEDQDNIHDITDDEPEGSSFVVPFDCEEEREGLIVYEGVCRSDNRDTISDNGDVIASYRTLSLPLKQDEWSEETVPQEGDKIELQRFGYKEYGLVIDRRPSNLGTHILWKYVRN